MGKSMRAKRLMAILCDGWIKGSGSASAKAGMNGGMDYLCGRLVYFDVRCLPPGRPKWSAPWLSARVFARAGGDIRLLVQRLGPHRVRRFASNRLFLRSH